MRKERVILKISNKVHNKIYLNVQKHTNKIINLKISKDFQNLIPGHIYWKIGQSLNKGIL